MAKKKKQKLTAELTADEIKMTLEQYANSRDIKNAIKYIEKHKDEISKIIDKYGSGNSYIASAYDISYEHEDFVFTKEYQRQLESIRTNALFDDEY